MYWLIWLVIESALSANWSCVCWAVSRVEAWLKLAAIRSFAPVLPAVVSAVDLARSEEA